MERESSAPLVCGPVRNSLAESRCLVPHGSHSFVGEPLRRESRSSATSETARGRDCGVFWARCLSLSLSLPLSLHSWVSISDYPLSAACVLSRITGALEEAWGVR